jgi:ribokinase
VNALQEGLISLLEGVEVVLMNERELFTLTGESSISDAVSGLRARGIDQVVVKVGEMGSIVVTPERSELVEAFAIDGVVDTTGAGDVYTAAFVASVFEGRDLLQAAWLANVAGALTTREIGAQRVVIDRATLLQQARVASAASAKSAAATAAARR